MSIKNEYRALGLRISPGGVSSGAWAVMLIQPGGDTPAAVVNTGKLYFDQPWLLEDLLRDVDFVAWEHHKLSEHTDKEWAFECGRVTGRIEALTVGFRARGNGCPVPSYVMERKREQQWTSPCLLKGHELGAVIIAWAGWGSHLLGKGESWLPPLPSRLRMIASRV